MISRLVRRFNRHFQPRTATGFTIVELLIVIVIIGVLATMTIVSYIGMNNRAIAASMQADLTSASTKLKLYQTDNMAYPTLINNCPTPTAGNICLKASPGNTYSYSVVNNTNPQTYSLTATNTNGKAYAVTQNSSPVVAVPVVVVAQNFNGSGSFTVPADISSLILEVWGGADSYTDNGGYAKGTLAVSASDVLNISVGAQTARDGGTSSINRVAGPTLLLATGGYDTGAFDDYDVGYGYVYAGITNTSTSGGTNPGAPHAVITYTTGG